jgi:hypothetical protein
MFRVGIRANIALARAPAKKLRRLGRARAAPANKAASGDFQRRGAPLASECINAAPGKVTP